MDMERTQVYLPKKLKKALHQLAAYEGSNLSALLRDAGEKLVEEKSKKKNQRDKEFLQVLDRTFGMWKDRDPKEFEKTRCSLDRRLDEWGI